MKSVAGVLRVMLTASTGASAQTTAGAEDNLKLTNITLPAAPAPVANYVTSEDLDEMEFLAGTVSCSGTADGWPTLMKQRPAHLESTLDASGFDIPS
jgi:hypothetical protein